MIVNLKYKDYMWVKNNAAKEFSKNGGIVLKRKVTKEDVWFGIHSNPNFVSQYEGEKEIVIGNKNLDVSFNKGNYYVNDKNDKNKD
jgi:hypothetical protein